MPLLLITPAADPLVHRWRAEHDWAARYGIPAHVTVRTPFLPPERWDPREIEPVLARFLPAEVTLARMDDRPGALVAVAEPNDGLWEMTAAATAAWPSLPPHKDGRPDAAFHLTVVRTPDAALRRRARAAIEPQLPMRVLGTEFWAAHGSEAAGATYAVVARGAPDPSGHVRGQSPDMAAS